MIHTIYNLNNHFVEIEKTKEFKPNGTMTEVWQWEISIANNTEDVYKGMAFVRNKNITLHWMELQSDNPLTEMINACKKYMDKA